MIVEQDTETAELIQQGFTLNEADKLVELKRKVEMKETICCSQEMHSGWLQRFRQWRKALRLSVVA